MEYITYFLEYWNKAEEGYEKEDYQEYEHYLDWAQQEWDNFCNWVLHMATDHNEWLLLEDWLMGLDVSHYA